MIRFQLLFVMSIMYRAGKPYIMGTECSHKEGSVQNPCRDIFGPHE